MRVDPDDLRSAGALLEHWLSDEWAWSISKITNPHHALSPWGPGVSVTLYGPDNIRVLEKAETVSLAANAALTRIINRDVEVRAD